jgi:hypothetical protein
LSSEGDADGAFWRLGIVLWRSTARALDLHDELLFRVGTGHEAVGGEPVVLGELSLLRGKQGKHRGEGVDAEVAIGWEHQPAAVPHLEPVTDRETAHGSSADLDHGDPEVVELETIRRRHAFLQNAMRCHPSGRTQARGRASNADTKTLL